MKKIFLSSTLIITLMFSILIVSCAKEEIEEVVEQTQVENSNSQANKMEVDEPIIQKFVLIRLRLAGAKRGCTRWGCCCPMIANPGEGDSNDVGFTIYEDNSVKMRFNRVLTEEEISTFELDELSINELLERDGQDLLENDIIIDENVYELTSEGENWYSVIVNTH